MRQQFDEYIVRLQDKIVTAFETLDPYSPPFKRDSWVRAEGGRGLSCVFSIPPGSPDTHSSALEKAGINTSINYGVLPPSAMKQMQADHFKAPFVPEGSNNLHFFGASFGLVIHPRNPSAPTVHANYRYMEITEPIPEGEKGPGKVLNWWFGGVSDLTPSYLIEEDAKDFHGTLKETCDLHGSDIYPAFKKWSDDYFFIPHRGETRGIGGIFFDGLNDSDHKHLGDLNRRPKTVDEIFLFVQSLGNAFIPSYIPILQRRMLTPFDNQMRRWQLIRRGRYVEFNLVCDRGTKFGLTMPGGRVEAILMTLPETAMWEYNCDLGTNIATEEGRMVEVLKKPREWV